MPDTQEIKPIGKLTPLIPSQDVKPVGELKPLDTDRSYYEQTGQLTPLNPIKHDPKVAELWGKPKEEEKGFGSMLLDALASGSASLGSGIAKTPAFIYDTFAAPLNYIASGRFKDDLLAIPQINGSETLSKANYDEFDKNHAAKSDYFKSVVNNNTSPGSLSRMIVNAPEKVAKFYDDVVTENHKQQADKYGASADEEFAKGNYGNALKILSLSTIESVPVMASLMLGNAAGVTTAESTLLGGAVFGAQKKAQLDQEFPDMHEGQKLAVSWLNGLSEGYIENSFGLTKLGKEIGGLFAKEGVEAGKKLAAEGFKDIYLPVLKKYGVNYSEEIGSEMTTQYVQNAIDKYVGGDDKKDLMDGVIDAGVMAGLMSTPIVGVAAKAELKQAKKGAEQFHKDEVIRKDAEQNRHALNIVQQGDDAVKNFKANVNEELKKGNLTPEDANKAITRINAYKEYNDITGTLNLPEETKLEVFDKTFQKQNLETELASFGDPKDLHPLKLAEYESKVKMSSDLQKDINKIIAENQAKKETTLGEKTINDLAKGEEKPKVGEKSKRASELLEAFKNKYKDKLPKEDTRTFEEIPAHEYNDSSKIKDRVKHQKTAEWLDTQPDKTAFGKITEREFSYDGKTNSVLGIDIDGKKLRFASSMLRPEGFRGHFRQEQFESEFPKGMDVGMKVEELPAFGEGDKPKKVIKAYRADNGKFIGWMKETTRGTSEYSPEQQEALAHLETVVEPPLDLFNESVKPTEPTTPVQPTQKVEPVKESVKEPIKEKPKTVKEEYEKPELKLNLIEDVKVLKEKLGKEPRKTSKGDIVEVNISAAKKQAEIKSEHERLKQLVDCIWA